MTAAQAQPPLCTTRDEAVNQLDRHYAERPVSLGITNSGGVLELLTSNNGATWTIVLTTPNGITCLIAAGVNWMELPKDKGTGL